MVEREIVGQPIPDILTKQFVESVHPYTMMFLYLAYEEGAHKSLSSIHLKVFDRYYVGDQTIEGQKSEKFRENLTAIIRDGFEILRENASDKLNEVFTENRVPYFKKSDIPFVDNAEFERKKLDSANRSISRMGKKKSEEAKIKISKARIRNWQDDRYRKKIRERMIEVKNKPEFVERTRATTKKYWEDPNNRERMSKTSTEKWQDPIYRKNVSKGIKRARKKRLQEHAKQQDSE